MIFHRLRAFFQVEGRGPRAPWRIFWVALIVRLLYITLAHTFRIKGVDDHYTFGFEAGRIAQALVTGHGYADPFSNDFVQHTGPTAWLPPLYPLLMAGVFKIFGLYTPLSAWVLLALNSVASAFTAMATWELGYRFAGSRVARWSGWLWALYPAAMQYAVKWLWEMTFTTALFTAVLVLSMRMRAEPEHRQWTRWTRWLLFGTIWALIGLSNSTVLLMLPITGLWILWPSRQSRVSHLRRSLTAPKMGSPNLLPQLLPATAAALLFLAILTPWTVRNERVFHTFIPMRGNLGAELYLANGPNANGFLMEYNHPFQAPDQLCLYRDLGEVRYVRLRGTLAKAQIAQDRGLFFRNTLKRVYFFWASVPHPIDGKPLVEFFRTLDYGFISVAGLLGLTLALHRRMPAAGLFAWAFLLLPLPYYPVTVHARFRHPLEPIICVLGVWLFQSAEKRKRSTADRHG